MAILFFVAIAPAVADVNSWIKPTSGYWEEQTSWLLGVLPNATQSVMFTNTGWKALAIGTNAAQKFPQSMQIQDLQISSPTNSHNTLLMDFTGFELPLQTTSLSIGGDSAVVVQGSSLEAGSAFLAGEFDQGDYSQVKIQGGMTIGRFSTGAYYLTNGTLSVNGALSMGGFDGLCKFVQYGGFNNLGFLSVFIEGEYDLYGGQVNATNGISVGDGDFATYSGFYQYDGKVNADLSVGGRYYLYGGTVTGRMSAPASSQRVNASIYQTGGTNFATSMDLSHPNKFGGAVSYVLSGGVVHVDSSTIFRGGWFYQYNGQHTVVSNFVMQGVFFFGLGHIYAEYMLAGGTLSVGNLVEPSNAHFNQNGGTNLIAGDLVLNGIPHYEDSSYNLEGGTLAVKNISIGDFAYLQHLSGNIIHSGTLILNQGTWIAAAGDYALGPLQLDGTNGNSTITFPGGSSILRLANSSEEAWSPAANLYINNWHGSVAGGGATRLYCGSDAGGLTSQQLALIKFSISGQLYPAGILATGEVVPQRLLALSRSGNTFTLTWSPGWFLQSATNVAGPYQDVPDAANTYTATFDSPSQFFRLRQ